MATLNDPQPVQSAVSVRLGSERETLDSKPSDDLILEPAYSNQTFLPLNPVDCERPGRFKVDGAV